MTNKEKPKTGKRCCSVHESRLRLGGADGCWRSPGGAALLVDAVVLAGAVSVGCHAAGSPLFPAVGHGVPLGARLSLQGTECTEG